MPSRLELGLADWGRKDSAKLAFLHINHYIEHGHDHAGHDKKRVIIPWACDAAAAKHAEETADFKSFYTHARSRKPNWLHLSEAQGAAELRLHKMENKGTTSGKGCRSSFARRSVRP